MGEGILQRNSKGQGFLGIKADCVLGCEMEEPPPEEGVAGEWCLSLSWGRSKAQGEKKWPSFRHVEYLRSGLLRLHN